MLAPPAFPCPGGLWPGSRRARRSHHRWRSRCPAVPSSRTITGDHAGARFRVLDLSTGRPREIYQGEPFFASHHVNAYERGGELVVSQNAQGVGKSTTMRMIMGLHRVEEVLAITGIEKAADRRAGKFSLGMSQRLGIAAALLGDPRVLLLDEPVNGLDPEGIRWIRNLLKNF